MSAFGQGSIANYSVAPLVEGYAKKVISSDSPCGNLVISSRDRFSGTYQNPVKQPYNNFTIQKGFPIQQGQIMSVKVAEINFPYVIPNVNDYNNLCVVLINGVAGIITVPTGFYTGTTLATAINARANILFPGHAPVLTYNADGTYAWVASAGDNIALYPLFQFDADPLTSYLTQPVTRDCLLTVMGFNFAYQDYTTASDGKISGFAPLLYTQYIDITSDNMTQFQDLPDASTGTPNTSHVICRLYIANETSTTIQDASGNPLLPGTFPFNIHRQFKNPKIMKWNSQNSIDRINIRLYDDQGRLVRLPTSGTTGYPDFQITLQSAE
jgi:hypothetical protein